MALCGSCKNKSCGYANEDVIRCGDFEENIVQTNANRIRAMSDEELAEYFADIGTEVSNGISYSERPEEWLEWLKQPVEGE